MSKEELIDVYDRDRQLTGLTIPRKSKLAEDQYMLYVYALIQNPEGKYLITRRSLDKKWAAGSWEVPGGGVSAGQTSLEAVQREIQEETGLDVTSCPARVALSYRNDDPEGGDNYFADVYIVSCDFDLADVTVEEAEVIDVALASLEDIRAIYEKDGFLHYERILQALEA